MTVPSWPGTLPQAFTRDSYAEQAANNLLRSENSVGPAKVRRKTTANTAAASGTLIMDDDQLAAFKTFYRDTIAWGSTAFTFPAQSGGSDWLVRITDPPEWGPLGLGWRVSIKLEILP